VFTGASPRLRRSRKWRCGYVGNLPGNKIAGEAAQESRAPELHRRTKDSPRVILVIHLIWITRVFSAYSQRREKMVSLLRPARGTKGFTHRTGSDRSHSACRGESHQQDELSPVKEVKAQGFLPDFSSHKKCARSSVVIPSAARDPLLLFVSCLPSSFRAHARDTLLLFISCLLLSFQTRQ
jgi:hypothetical protein